MHSLAGWLFLGLSSTLLLPAGATAGQEDEAEATPTPLFISAERVVVRPGKVLENAQVVVQGGRIVAVGQGLEKPAGAEEIRGQTVCAGFIDPWSALGVASDSLGDENTSPATRTVDALDTYANDHLREAALRAGVTVVRAQAGSKAQLGGVGALVRLADGEGRVVLSDSNMAMAAGLSKQGRGGATMGPGGQVVFTAPGLQAMDPFDRVDQVDRLVSQLELGERYREDWVEYRHDLEEWEKKITEEEEKLDKDFKKAKKARDKAVKDAEEKDKEHKEKRYKEDKKPKLPKYDADRDALGRVADGELPLVVHVNRAAELRALLDKTKALGRLRLMIAGGTEALPFADELKSRGITVIVWPALRGKGGPDEYSGHDLALAAELREAGVAVLLGSGGTDASATRDLPLLAAMAVGHGLDREAAFAALTVGAARAFDVADRLGSVERGKDADLLVLDGEPLQSTTRVQYVISGGDVVISPEE